jgi:hypothetical protein
MTPSKILVEREAIFWVPRKSILEDRETFSVETPSNLLYDREVDS